MVEFSKKYKISEVSNSYQISVRGAGERKAVITKFADEKTWSVALWSKDTLEKSRDVIEGFRKLSDAKHEATSWVDYII